MWGESYGMETGRTIKRPRKEQKRGMVVAGTQMKAVKVVRSGWTWDVF